MDMKTMVIEIAPNGHKYGSKWLRATGLEVRGNRCLVRALDTDDKQYTDEIEGYTSLRITIDTDEKAAHY